MYYALGPPTSFELAVLHRSVPALSSSPESALPQLSPSSTRSSSFSILSPSVSPAISFSESARERSYSFESPLFPDETEDPTEPTPPPDNKELQVDRTPVPTAFPDHKAERTFEGVTPFISRLIVLLRHPELYGKAIHWNKSGTAVCFYPDAPAFCTEILPCFFAHRNPASFRRQLNVYSFKRLAKSHTPTSQGGVGSAVTYLHPDFTRDNENDRYPMIQPTISKARRLQNDEKTARGMRK